MPSRSSRRTYNRVVATDDTTPNDSVSIESNALDEPLSPSPSSQDENDTNNNNSSSVLTSKLDDDTNQSVSIPPIYNEIKIILMDSTQSKFNIKCDATWTISQFKEVSSTITKVPKQSQRLIHMGKLLKDDMTLNEYGINETDKIIHLFPKPNVVVNNSSTADNSGDDETTESPEGAHIPQIILDEDEANRRSQILILSSQEIFEAQHRVKIFSFLLMIISSMELLTLMTLFIGVQTEGESNSPYGGGGDTTTLPPGNPTDTPPSSGGSGGGNSNMQMRVWQNSDYFDAVISAFGFYVSLLGIRATTENTLQLAKRYFICVTIAGVLSNCYYYYLNIQATSKQASNRNQHLDPTELYTTSFVQILLPLTVWLLCIIRAHQFQVLIREAEVEAEERARGLNNNDEDENVGGSSGDNIEGQEEEGDAPRVLQYGSDDLELAVERGVPS